jgi:hypothetical protein
MQTISLQINNDSALKTWRGIEPRHVISILENSNVDSLSLPGPALNLNEFKSWIRNAEQTSTVFLNDVKEKWASKRKQLQKPG